jgi:predicted helicase
LFNAFLEDLRLNLNPTVSSVEAIRMLAQHLVTKPIFEALFQNYAFVLNNPVSVSLDKMIALLESHALAKDATPLNAFYDKAKKSIVAMDNSRIKQFVSGIDNSSARQQIIVDLYNNFFNEAFPDVVDRLGVVYTPVEVVDFINQSVAKVLQKEFGRELSDEGVHILDPFTGTGTFITRLIETGLWGDSLERKYDRELHANEIVLLAYYIGSINIENAYHAALGEETNYKPFKGICLTDTFQLYEENKSLILDSTLKLNSERVEAQKSKEIVVIIGNPPYSAGQSSANSNAQNTAYPALDKKIAGTYAKYSTTTNKNSLYDVRCGKAHSPSGLKYPPGCFYYCSGPVAIS